MKHTEQMEVPQQTYVGTRLLYVQIKVGVFTVTCLRKWVGRSEFYLIVSVLFSSSRTYYVNISVLKTFVSKNLKFN